MKVRSEKGNMRDRMEYLKTIEDLNKQLGFIGCRGEMYLSEERLKELIERLRKESKRLSRKEVKNK